jgi:hypothetical protein
MRLNFYLTSTNRKFVTKKLNNTRDYKYVNKSLLFYIIFADLIHSKTPDYDKKGLGDNLRLSIA